MGSVTLEVSSREKVNQRFLRAFQGNSQGPCISFETPEVLFKVISGKRWGLLKVMMGAGPMTIREAAVDGSGCEGGTRRCSDTP